MVKYSYVPSIICEGAGYKLTLNIIVDTIMLNAISTVETATQVCNRCSLRVFHYLYCKLLKDYKP